MSEKNDMGCTTAVGVLTTTFVLATTSTLLRGWLMHDCYAWFVLPLWTGMPTLTIGQCIGVQCFVTASFTRIPDESRAKAIAKHLGVEPEWKTALGALAGRCLMIWPLLWCAAWLTHWLIGGR